MDWTKQAEHLMSMLLDPKYSHCDKRNGGTHKFRRGTDALTYYDHMGRKLQPNADHAYAYCVVGSCKLCLVSLVTYNLAYPDATLWEPHTTSVHDGWYQLTDTKKQLRQMYVITESPS